MNPKLRASTLICYEGGGYDGCIWEWNFAVIDKNGDFQDIYSSGCSGCETLLKLEAFMEEKSNRYYTYNLDNQDYSFENVLIAGLTAGLVEKLNELYSADLLNHPAVLTCDDCKCKTDEGITTDPVGCGGIVAMNSTKLCADCYEAGCCSYCGDYYGDERDREQFTLNHYCSYCYKHDSNLRKIRCIKEDDCGDLEVDEEYYFINEHRDDNGVLKEVSVAYGTYNDSVEKFPADIFDISYEEINPNQQKLFK
tara:strand:- start:182 stop:937 length:756 start_codon:yes stop_codon:yes gene_type:complete